MTRHDSSETGTERATRIFVYGTLLAGESNHRLLRGLPAEGAIRTHPRYLLVDMGGYPAMLRGGSVAVVGETYQVPPEVLRDLDELEEHPGYYRRQSISLSDETEAQAWLLPSSFARGAPMIPSGDWRNR